MKNVGLFLILLCVSFGCAKKVKVAHRNDGVTANGQHWSCVTTDERKWACIVQSDEALAAAKASMGCGICALAEIGTAYQIERLAQ